ncbi:MAG TPA: extensin, partial [Sphingomonas sp.]|nr:extensin [Sphingomonas sp.]
MRRALRAAAIVAALLALAFAAYALLRSRPQDLPWTRLDLGQPVGLFTGRKLAGLTQDFEQCRALLTAAGVRYTVLAPLESGER